MIESKSRKAAFLTEAVRALSFRDVQVESERLEELVRRTEPRSVDMITVRAVRSSQPLFKDLHHVLCLRGAFHVSFGRASFGGSFRFSRQSVG